MVRPPMANPTQWRTASALLGLVDPEAAPVALALLVLGLCRPDWIGQLVVVLRLRGGRVVQLPTRPCRSRSRNEPLTKRPPW